MKNIGRVLIILIMLLSTLVMYQNCSGYKLDTNTSLYIRKSVTVLIKKYCPIDNYTFEEVFATNMSHVRDGYDFVLDSDRDGLSDRFENSSVNMNRFNISSSKSDTNGDGYSDGVTVSMGLEKDKQVNLRICDNPAQDTDYDNLTDCEENILRTLYNNPDTDGDNIPDGIEVRFGLNPLDQDDAYLDFDNDLRVALVEVKANTPHTITDVSDVSAQSYKYEISNYKANVNGVMKSCYDVAIKNIPVMETAGSAGGNLVLVNLVEHLFSPSEGDISKLKVFQVVMPAGALSGIVIELESINDSSHQFQSFAVDVEGKIK